MGFISRENDFLMVHRKLLFSFTLVDRKMWATISPELSDSFSRFWILPNFTMCHKFKGVLFPELWSRFVRNFKSMKIRYLFVKDVTVKTSRFLGTKRQDQIFFSQNVKISTKTSIISIKSSVKRSRLQIWCLRKYHLHVLSTSRFWEKCHEFWEKL